MSPISNETDMRADQPIKDSSDPKTQQTNTAIPLSHIVPATQVSTLPQQGSTQPGDGGEVHADGHMEHDARTSDRHAQHTEKVPFKEQVIGYAQKTRGTLLRKPDLKEHGEMILEGQTTHEQERHEQEHHEQARHEQGRHEQGHHGSAI